MASDAGGMAELVAKDDRERILVAGDDDRLARALMDALAHGMRPATLAFEPSLVGLRLVALHEKLASEARSPWGVHPSLPRESDALPGTGIVYGGEGAGDWAKEVNQRVADLVHRPGQIDQIGAETSMQNQTGRASSTEPSGCVDAPADDLLFLHHAAVRPHVGAFSAMQRLMAKAGVDAVVVGYRAADESNEGRWGHHAGPTVMAPAGPAEQAVLRNLFGAGLFLIKRSWFLRLGGFDTDLPSSTFAHWDLLNRLHAEGGEVMGIPKAMATVDHQTAIELQTPVSPSFADRLLQPWLQQAPPALQGFIRMATAPRSVALIEQASAPDGPRKAADDRR